MFSYQKKYRNYIENLVSNFIKKISNSNLEKKEVLEEGREEEKKKQVLEEGREEEKKEKNNIFKKYTEYFFLPEKQLHNTFNFDRDLTKEFEIHLCIYRINTILPMPYLEYYFENPNLEYIFPFKKISPEVFKDINEGIRIEPMEKGQEGEKEKDEDEDEDDEINDIFLEQCYNFFKEKANYKGDINEFENIYRGFVFFKHEKEGKVVEDINKIVIVIDSTNIDIFKIKDTKQIWAITYEILDLKKIIDTDINSNIIEIFKNNKILNNIKKYITTNNATKSENLVYPKILYLCKDEDTNVYYHEGDNPQNTKTLIYEKIKHPILKDIYLFSKDRFISDNIETVKRFVLFIYEKNMIDGELNETNIPEEPIIGFKKGDKEFWCCKTSRFFVESGEH